MQFDLRVLTAPAYAEAQRISLSRTRRFGTRTLDVLYVACARMLEAGAFYTFDERLARAEGLRTL